MAWKQSFFRIAAAVSRREADTDLGMAHRGQHGIGDSRARRRSSYGGRLLKNPFFSNLGRGRGIDCHFSNTEVSPASRVAISCRTTPCHPARVPARYASAPPSP